uniref:Uncharacterized protein n=1 Tax=Romanomermis culicivorax TaxID=13658 RepID=A0A915IMW8_ROMCU
MEFDTNSTRKTRNIVVKPGPEGQHHGTAALLARYLVLGDNMWFGSSPDLKPTENLGEIANVWRI